MAVVALKEDSILLVRPTADEIQFVTKDIVELLDIYRDEYGCWHVYHQPNKSALIYTIDPTHTHVTHLSLLAEQSTEGRVFFKEHYPSVYPYSLRGSNSLPLDAIVLMLVTTWASYWDRLHARGAAGYGKLPLFCRGAAKILGCSRAGIRRTIDQLLVESGVHPTPPPGRVIF